jgi:hypothetical protein
MQTTKAITKGHPSWFTRLVSPYLNERVIVRGVSREP